MLSGWDGQYYGVECIVAEYLVVVGGDWDFWVLALDGAADFRASVADLAQMYVG